MRFNGTEQVARLAAAAAMVLAGAAVVAQTGPARRVALRTVAGGLRFERNIGQVDKRVKYFSRGAGGTLFLTTDEAVLALPGRPVAETVQRAAAFARPEPRRRGPGAVLRMKLVGANRLAPAAGLGRLPGITNYLIGKDPTKWRTNVPSFGRVRFAGVFPGTDLVYYSAPRSGASPGGVEYDFVVRPGGDPGRIRVAFEGARSLRVAANGDLVARTAAGDVRWKRPYAYQTVAGKRVRIAAAYDLQGKHAAFRLARYDRTRPVVVDPVLLYSTFLGGSGDDATWSGIAVDNDGAAYVTGESRSADFPTSSGAYDTSHNGDDDAFVTKLNATGTAVAYSTFLGGSVGDQGRGIAVDSSGAAFVTGSTQSTDLPTTSGAFDRSFGGNEDAFVAKLNAAGTALVYSTYLGGSGIEKGLAAAVAGDGSAYLTGFTESADFPTTAGAYDVSHNGNADAFVVKLNAGGTALTYSTLIGASYIDYGCAIAIDSGGSAYVTGFTALGSFPTTAGAWCRTPIGGYD
ncbi:MAG: SBBP repeat-containing protein [Armatimonadetes bacterium]|nr:SBBP repeat-containing protein [Armatimonadota bacterium]